MIAWQEQTLDVNGIGVYESPQRWQGRVDRTHESLGFKWLATVLRTHVPSGRTWHVQFAMPIRRDVDVLIAMWNGFSKNPTTWRYELIEAELLDSHAVFDRNGRRFGAYCYRSTAESVARRCNEGDASLRSQRPFTVAAAPQPRLYPSTAARSVREVAHG